MGQLTIKDRRKTSKLRDFGVNDTLEGVNGAVYLGVDDQDGQGVRFIELHPDGSQPPRLLLRTEHGLDVEPVDTELRVLSAVPEDPLPI